MSNTKLDTAMFLRLVSIFSGDDQPDTQDDSAPFQGLDLSGIKVVAADLRRANLSAADLRRADLSDADLSAAKNVPSAIEYLEANFETTTDGYIAYKTFGRHYPPNSNWIIKAGSVLSEVVNPDRGTDCGSGINVARRGWGDFGGGTLWKVLIRWAWLPGVIVPFGTDGKIRCERVELIEEVEN